MFLSIRRYQTTVEHVEELVRRSQEGFIPLISQSEGFYAYYGVDAGNGVAVTISVFETKAQAEASNAQAASWVAEHLAPLLPNAPEVSTGEVRVYEVT